MSLLSDEPLFERMNEPLVGRRQFLGRLARSFAITLVIVAASLAMGMAGYHFIGGLPWIDALHNAAMILTGMGPVDPMRSNAAKLFASFYALYSGVAFLTLTAVLMAPVVHRALHKFHVVEEDQSDQNDDEINRPPNAQRG